MNDVWSQDVNIHRLRRLFCDSQPKKPKPLIPDLERDLKHGWILPYLYQLDSMMWGRWDYWMRCQLSPELPKEPLPQIEFCLDQEELKNPTRTMLERCLDAIPNHGSWQTWGGWQFFDYFLGWLLYGFGHAGQTQLPEEPQGCEGASMRLYQLYNLDQMLLYPQDYFAPILAESNYGKGQGFYPTPMNICQMMTGMVFSKPGEGDYRLERFGDPCTGTGRFPLCASNYTLRLVCMDIDPTLCRATLVNGYLYAPWLVKPIWWLEPELCKLSEAEPCDKGQRPTGAVGCGNALGIGDFPLQMSQAEVDRKRAEWAAEQAAEKEGKQAAKQRKGKPAPVSTVKEKVTYHTPPAVIESIAAQMSDTLAEQAPAHAQGYLFETEFDAAGTSRTAPILKRKRKEKEQTLGMEF